MRSFVIKSIGYLYNALALVAPTFAARKALDLFCTPRAGRHKPHHKEYLRGFGFETVDTGVGSIAVYHKTGTGLKVLFCHGWESNAFRWRKVVKALGDTNYDIYVMEAPAHGASGGERFTAPYYAEAMRVVVKNYNIQAMVAHSVGGFAMCYAAHKGWLSGIRRGIIMAPPDTLDLITDNYFKLLGYSQRLRKYYDALIEERFGYPTSYFNASDFAIKLHMPGILIHDREDDINLFFEGEAVATAWPKGRLIATEGYGHSLQDPEVYTYIRRELELTVGKSELADQ